MGFGAQARMKRRPASPFLLSSSSLVDVREQGIEIFQSLLEEPAEQYDHFRKVWYMPSKNDPGSLESQIKRSNNGPQFQEATRRGMQLVFQMPRLR
jgi:hypothetical protein